MTGVQLPTASGTYLKSVDDCLRLLEGVRQGILPRVTRRLTKAERSMVDNGRVFVFEEEESGMCRWTDGRRYSCSRVSGDFLAYDELYPDAGSTRRLNDGLIKQTFSTVLRLPNQLPRKFHLIAYFRARSVPNLQRPSCNATYDRFDLSLWDSNINARRRVQSDLPPSRSNQSHHDRTTFQASSTSITRVASASTIKTGPESSRHSGFSDYNERRYSTSGASESGSESLGSRRGSPTSEQQDEALTPTQEDDLRSQVSSFQLSSISDLQSDVSRQPRSRGMTHSSSGSSSTSGSVRQQHQEQQPRPYVYRSRRSHSLLASPTPSFDSVSHSSSTRPLVSAPRLVPYETRRSLTTSAMLPAHRSLSLPSSSKGRPFSSNDMMQTTYFPTFRSSPPVSQPPLMAPVSHASYTSCSSHNAIILPPLPDVSPSSVPALSTRLDYDCFQLDQFHIHI